MQQNREQEKSQNAAFFPQCPLARAVPKPGCAFPGATVMGRSGECVGFFRVVFFFFFAPGYRH